MDLTVEDRVIMKEFLKTIGRSNADNDVEILRDEWHQGQMMLRFKRKKKINLMVISALLADYEVFLPSTVKMVSCPTL